jgi:hypothetical protein
MKEIYWLSRLDGILTASGVLLTLSVVAIVAIAILSLIDGEDELLMSAERRQKILNVSVIICIITTLICSFVPSSKTAMTIWGVGSVIDYVQENNSLKELPDKCLKALEVWADSLNEEEKE